MRDEQSWIAESRLRPFMGAASGDRQAATRLYAWNIEVSSAFWGPIHLVEIAFREAVHTALAGTFGREAWWEVAGLTPDHLRMVAEATSAVSRRGADVTPDLVVSELALGFWVALVSNRYHSRLWDAALWRVLAEGSVPLRRRDLHAALTGIRLLRNAIAHHEPVFGRDLATEYDALLRMLGQIRPGALAALESMSRVPVVLARRSAVVDGLAQACF